MKVSWWATIIGLLSLLGIVLHLTIDLLIAFLELLSFLLELNLLASVLIQIELEVCFFLEVFVGVWKKLRVLFNLPYFFEVLWECLRPTGRFYPLLCLFDNFLDYLVLYDYLDVY